MPSRMLKTAPLAFAIATASLSLIIAAAPAAARSQSRTAVAEAAEPAINGRAAIAVVSIKDQRISLYGPDGGVVRGRISSGQVGYETPVGVFSILQKKVEHTSNLYDDAQMPYMQRITWSGVALHAGNLPGYPASHGCVRLPYGFAQNIFPLTKLGMRVVISRHDVAPADISHPLLLKPAPVRELVIAKPTAYQPESGEDSTTILEPDVRAWPERQALLETLRDEVDVKAEEAKAAVEAFEALNADLKKRKKERALIAKRDQAARTKKRAEADVQKAADRLANAKSERSRKRAEKAKEWAEKAFAKAADKLEDATEAAAEAEKVVSRLNEAIETAKAAKIAAVEAAAEAKRRTLPVSIFISRKSQKLYVRQGNEPVFDVKVAIAEPEHKIGTHVFTALDFANGGNDVKWNVVSILRDPRGADADLYDDDDGGYDEDEPRSRRTANKRTEAAYAPPVTDVKAAEAALERISIPADVRAKISTYVWPGSSVIISDEEMSRETGKGTDFIVVASDEPQGALKIRPRQPPPLEYRDYYDDDYYYYRPYRRYRYERRPPVQKKFFWW